MTNLLLISGTGRNVGKTTLACKIINKFNNITDVTGIKISPHLHKLDGNKQVIINSNECIILKETEKHCNKDSSRMYKAGASTVYYIQTKDKYLKDAFDLVFENMKSHQPVICESGGLIHYINPGLFVIMGSEKNSKIKPQLLRYVKNANLISSLHEMDIFIEGLIYRNNKWNLKNVRVEQNN